MSKTLEQDYIDLFSYARKGHMAKYVHMYRPGIYDKVIRQDDYYPFKVERDLIIQKGDRICKSIQGVTQAIEFGPGSSTPMKDKTIPFLKALDRQCSFTTYIAMDSNLVYAEQACELVQKEFNTINTEAIEIDFLLEQGCQNINFNQDTGSKKLMFGFGQAIFSNNDEKYIAKFVNNIGFILKNGDFLLFGLDTNRDEILLEAAYNSKMAHELLLNTMYHLKKELTLENFDPELFDFIYKWNHKESTVENYLKSTQNQRFMIGCQEIVIKENQEFNILNSRKMWISQIESFLNKEQIHIMEIVTLDNCRSYSIIIAQKHNI